ncbi:MAG: DUF4838 domain-containing protein [Lentisphaerae bacterium]|nr:DUF4838 domain-containing protein [Lentisphaerota bacterium]MBR2873948.1 DUF4838 domain-containing protein [Lentisphaeria bacterium]
MKHFLTLFLTGVLFLSFAGAAELEIVKNGKTSYVIAFPEKASLNLNREYRYASQLLRDLIKERTGVYVHFVNEKDVKPGQKAIFVGPGKNAAKRGMIKKWALNEYRMKADKGDIFLLGDDDDPSPAKRVGYHSMRNGSVKAVLEFAKQYVGADFLYPGRKGISVPKSGTLTVPDSLNKDAVPYTMFAIGRGMEQYYALANDMLPAPWYKCHGGHSHIPAIPPAKYLKSNLEYFAIVRGKRNGYPGIPQYCLSNPDVQKLIYKELVDTLGDPRFKESQLAQTDGFRVCECGPCKEFFKPGAGQAVWKLHLDMAKRLLKDRPGKSVRIIAYGPTVYPPKGMKFPENVSVTIAAGQRLDEKYLKSWYDCKVPKGFDIYLYNWGEYHVEGLTPTFTLTQAQKQTAMFRKFGVNALYFCGLAELPGLNMPVITYYLRTFAGDKTAPEKFLKDFCAKTYGAKAAPFMEKFYTLLYSRVEKVKAGKEDYTDPGRKNVVTSVFARNVALLHDRYPDGVIAELEKLLAAAEKNAVKGQGDEMFRHARWEFDYLKLTAGACNAFYAYHKTPDQKTFERLAKLIVERKKFINSLPTYKRGSTSYHKPVGNFNTLGNFPLDMVMVNGRLAAPLQAPFNWDVEFYLEKKMRPSGRVLKAGDPQWQQMIDIFANKNVKFVKDHPLFVRCKVQGENLIAEMRFDNLPKENQKGTVEVRLQKDNASPRYRLWGSSLGGYAGIHKRTKSQQGNDYSDAWDLKPAEQKQFKVAFRRIVKEGQSPVLEMTIPLALFGGPVKKGEKRFIDFVYHTKSYCYTWEYNINLINWRHRYTGIGTVEF